jgi:DNA adenine methylase
MNESLLRRLGNKSKIAERIYSHFPPHKIYIEAFFGAGGMFFNKPKAKYNILNDLDSDVYNLFTVVSTQMEELETAFLAMPMHQDLWDHWRKNTETDPIRRALRFLFLSNYGFMGKANTLRYLAKNTSKILYENIRTTNEYIFGCEFSNFDFRELFRRIPLGENIDDTFIYCDPPYLGTSDNYKCSLVFQKNVISFYI